MQVDLYNGCKMRLLCFVVMLSIISSGLLVSCFRVLFCDSALMLPSVLCCCWLGGRKSIRPVKN